MAKSKKTKGTKPKAMVAATKKSEPQFAGLDPTDIYMSGYSDALKVGNKIVREHNDKLATLQAELDFHKETLTQIQSAGKKIGLPPFGHSGYDTADDFLAAVGTKAVEEASASDDDWSRQFEDELHAHGICSSDYPTPRSLLTAIVQHSEFEKQIREGFASYGFDIYSYDSAEALLDDFIRAVVLASHTILQGTTLPITDPARLLGPGTKMDEF